MQVFDRDEQRRRTRLRGGEPHQDGAAGTLARCVVHRRVDLVAQSRRRQVEQIRERGLLIAVDRARSDRRGKGLRSLLAR